MGLKAASHFIHLRLMTVNKLLIGNHLKNKQWLLFALPAAGVIADQLSSLNNPYRSPLTVMSKLGGFLPYLKFLILEIYPFEVLTVGLLWLFLSLFNKIILQNASLTITVRAVLLYALKMLPVLLVAILFIAPVSNAARYLVLFYPHYKWAVYYPEWVMTAAMYFNYLLPLLIVGYMMLGINLIFSFAEQRKVLAQGRRDTGTEIQLADENKHTPNFIESLKGSDVNGITLLKTSEVLWFEVAERIYYAYTPTQYKIQYKLSDLETVLNPSHFFRINRFQIISVAALKSYAYWENDKYIVRLKDAEEEFIVTRKRMKQLKELLNQ